MVFIELLNFKSFEDLDNHFSFVFISLEYLGFVASKFFV